MKTQSIKIMTKEEMLELKDIFYNFLAYTKDIDVLCPIFSQADIEEKLQDYDGAIEIVQYMIEKKLGVLTNQLFKSLSMKELTALAIVTYGNASTSITIRDFHNHLVIDNSLHTNLNKGFRADYMEDILKLSTAILEVSPELKEKAIRGFRVPISEKQSRYLTVRKLLNQRRFYEMCISLTQYKNYDVANY